MDPKYFIMRQNLSIQIQKVKNQLQDKLQEMLPLPEILKMTQTKLKEARTMHQLVDKNNKEIAKELNVYKTKLAEMDNDNVVAGQESKHILALKMKDLEEQLTDLQQLNNSLKTDLNTFQDNCDKYEKLAETRLREITLLETQLECLIAKTQACSP